VLGVAVVHALVEEPTDPAARGPAPAKIGLGKSLAKAHGPGKHGLLSKTTPPLHFGREALGKASGVRG